MSEIRWLPLESNPEASYNSFLERMHQRTPKGLEFTFMYPSLEVIVPCNSVGTGDHETYNHLYLHFKTGADQEWQACVYSKYCSCYCQ